MHRSKHLVVQVKRLAEQLVRRDELALCKVSRAALEEVARVLGAWQVRLYHGVDVEDVWHGEGNGVLIGERERERDSRGTNNEHARMGEKKAQKKKREKEKENKKKKKKDFCRISRRCSTWLEEEQSNFHSCSQSRLNGERIIASEVKGRKKSARIRATMHACGVCVRG